MRKTISILGSTGSIGLNTLHIVRKKKKLFKINLLAANKNYKLICNQINEFKPKIFIVSDLKVFKKVKKNIKHKKTKIFYSFNFPKKILIPSDVCVAAIPGIAGLNPTVLLIEKSKKLLIANKESIICGWDIIKKLSSKFKTKIIPIDSEHFSIMKLLENQKLSSIKKIYLTASGGPFLNYNPTKLKNVKPKEAIKHPKWKMGKKISIDSSNLMNKLLELIEAQKLFSIDLKKLDIVIHPESLVHAIIELKNGLFKFIYHETTMVIPLANAIFDDKIEISDFIKPKLNKKNSFFFNNLNFLNVDKQKFPLIKLKKRLNEHRSTPIIINAVNEILVEQFLDKKISFNSFYRYLLLILNDRNYKKYAVKLPKNINQIYEIDIWSRNVMKNKILRNSNA
tara:strand:+ start:1196 stop:2383 length:1188 start_codon:yes stop_codon:yes gene_type:complete